MKNEISAIASKQWRLKSTSHAYLMTEKTGRVRKVKLVEQLVIGTNCYVFVDII